MRWFRKFRSSSSESDEIQQLCNELVRHPDRETADELATRGAQGVLPLLTVLDDWGGDAWDATMYTIRKIGLSAMPNLSVALLLSPKPAVRANAATGLGVIRVPQAAMFLVATLTNNRGGETQKVCSHCAEALGMVGNPLACVALSHLTDHSRFSASVQQDMLRAMKVLNKDLPPGFDLLDIRLMYHYSEEEIQQMKQNCDINGLIEASGFHNTYTRGQAMEALAELDDPRVIPVLVKLLRWGDYKTVRALSKIPDPEIIPPLIDVLIFYPFGGDVYKWELEEALEEAVASVGAKRAKPIVAQALNNLEFYFHALEESFETLLNTIDTTGRNDAINSELDRHRGLLQFFADNIVALEKVIASA